MKYSSLLLFIIIINVKVFAQLSSTADKPPIDSNAICSWPSLTGKVFISNNGKYFSYNIANQPVNSNTLVLRSTVSSWTKEWPGAHTLTFSTDSKQLILMSNDSLYFFQTGNRNTKCIPHVTNIQQPRYEQGQWLAYKLKDSNNMLVLQNLITAKEWHFPAVIEYVFNNNGHALLLKTAAEDGDKKFTKLQYVALPSGNVTDIWTASRFPERDIKVTNYCLDESGNQAAFIVSTIKAGRTENSLWHYKKDKDQAVLKADDQSEGIQPGLLLSDQMPNFSDDGRYIYFNLQAPEIKLQSTVGPENLDIWNYKEIILHSAQLQHPQTSIYKAIISSNKNDVIQLEKENEFLAATPSKGDFIVLRHCTIGDRFWKGTNDATSSYYILSLNNGTTTPIKTTGYCPFVFSPGGKYLVYFSSTKDSANYYSYELSTGKTTNISTPILQRTLAYNDEFYKFYNAFLNNTASGIAGWLQDDTGLLVYDNYDIWLLDPSGNNQPKNITNGYGRSNHIRFRLANEKDQFYRPTIRSKDETLLLTGFDVNNKYNGFYRKQLSEQGNPKLLTMGPWTLCYDPGYQATATDHTFSHGMSPLKAADVNVWVVQRQTSSEAPNYFLTTNFKNYTELTDLQPQQRYNWLTTELLSWKQLDGTMSQGILYKPENFDPKKQYPVLFNYYQQFSGRMYEYPVPDFTGTNINIPWFVSRGYLVFTPDIHFTTGQFGKSAYNTIVSATKMLSKLQYIDSKHIGLNGHSAAGYLTNYLVTHTDIFAAAMEGAGVSDLISGALQLAGNGSSRLEIYELFSMGGSIWDRRDNYIEGSPILNADKITTPLLIFHNKGDGAVPWEQAVELFIALRRLQKPVWMLQYNNNGHGVDGKDAIDLTIRVTQFFDHYLKGAPPPVWMTQGIPARFKGIKTGYELDTSGSTGSAP